MAVITSGIDPQRDGDAVTGPPGDFGSGDTCVEAKGDTAGPQIVESGAPSYHGPVLIRGRKLHAISCADPRPGAHSPGFRAYRVRRGKSRQAGHCTASTAMAPATLTGGRWLVQAETRYKRSADCPCGIRQRNAKVCTPGASGWRE